jgi:hypothetical protein
MDGVVFSSEDDFDRMSSAVRYLEQLRRSGVPPANIPPPPGISAISFRVTGNISGRYYPAVEVFQNYEEVTETWYDGTEVRAMTLNSSEKLESGRRYWGLVIGDYDSYPVVLAQGDRRHKIKGKMDNALTPGASATMSVWEVVSGTEVDTGEDVTVYDWVLSTGQTVALGANAYAYWDVKSGRWYLDGAKCP